MLLPELLCPAGDLSRLKAAIHFGADAVYLAGETMGMRSASHNFTPSQLLEAIQYAHERGKKVYLACNAMLRNHHFDALPELLIQWANCGVDALIVGDMGALRLVKQRLPDMPVHISVQTGLSNYEAVRAMADLGASRVILSRELTLDEIATIRAKAPAEMELEAFVHGSMCVSVSGRCLLSDYMTMQESSALPVDKAKNAPNGRYEDRENSGEKPISKPAADPGTMDLAGQDAMNLGGTVPGSVSGSHPDEKTIQELNSRNFAYSPLSCRSGNGGDCAQPCRWKYALMEEKRPGEYYPVYETQEGSFILNSKDLCMISHLPELAAAGISSFKIEGRAKSAYYAAVTANAYRCALNEWQACGCSKDYTPSAWIVEELNKVSHRPYSTGFYLGERGGQHTSSGGYVRDYEVMGVVTGSAQGRITASQRNKLYAGDRIELLEPGRPPIPYVVEQLRDGEGNAIESTPHPTMPYSFACDYPAPPGTLIRRVSQR